VLGLVRLLDLGPRVFPRCRNMPETGYSLVAGLTSGNAKRRDSLRFHPYGFTVGWHPRQLLGFSGVKRGPLGATPTVDTENPVRIENAGFRCVREIIIVSTMTPFFIALLALIASTFRTRAVQQAEILALRH